MFRKLIVVTVVGGLAVATLHNSRIGSYLRSELRGLQESAEDQIPPEKEITRLREEISKIDQDLRKVVKQKVALEQERDELLDRKTIIAKNLPGMRDRMNARAEVVRSAEDRAKNGEAKVAVVFRDEHAQPLVEAKHRLEVQVREVVSAEKELQRIEKKVDALNRMIGKLDTHKAAMQNAKSEAGAAIDEVESDLLDLKTMQLDSKYPTDDTRTSRIKEATAKLRKKIDLKKRELAALQDVSDDVAGKSVDEILAPATKRGAAISTPANAKE